MENEVYNERFVGLPLQFEYIDGIRVRLIRDAAYVIARGPYAGHASTVTAGFEFDWASVPRLFWRIFPPAGDGHNPYGIAAMWHDWIYEHQAINGIPCSRLDADNLFKEIMEQLEVHKLVIHTLYRCVRIGGWVGWNRNERAL